MTPEESLGIKKQATEETLQSIDNTLKRIEAILLHLCSEEQNLSVAAACTNVIEGEEVI